MRKRTWIGIVALSAIAVVALAIYGILPPRDPIYHGRKLSSWLEGYDTLIDQSRTNAAGPRNADEAVRAAGEAAIPTLLRLLQAYDTPSMLKLIDFAQRQHFVEIRHAPAERLNAEAAWAFLALGPRGSNAVPALIRVYAKNISPTSKSRAAASLGYIGPPAREAVPALLRGMGEEDGEVRHDAIQALGQIRGEPEHVVPALIERLQDSYTTKTSPPNRVLAARALGSYGPRSKSAVPALLKMANDPHDFLASFSAEVALNQIDADAAAQVKPRGLRAGK